MEEENPDWPLPPPDARSAALRILCLAVVSAMADIAIDLERNPADSHEADAFVAKLLEWQRAEGLSDFFSNAERAMLERHLTGWTHQEVLNATWRQEAIGVLTWAISKYHAVPAYDTEFKGVAEAIPLLTSAEPFLTEARLRPAEEIEQARDVAQLWHWRSRTTQLQSERGAYYVSVLDYQDLDSIVRDTAEHAHKAGDIPPPIDADFPAFGKAYRDLDDEEYATATSIAMERHFALNWLCGYSSDWDETPTDT